MLSQSLAVKPKPHETNKQTNHHGMVGKALERQCSYPAIKTSCSPAMVTVVLNSSAELLTLKSSCIKK